MPNKIFINSDNFIEVQIVGDQAPDDITTLGTQIEQLCVDLRAKKLPVCILTNSQQQGKFDKIARERIVELAKTLPYDRMAIVGQRGLIRLGANLVLQAMGRGTATKYFDDQTEALHWLAEQPAPADVNPPVAPTPPATV